MLSEHLLFFCYIVSLRSLCAFIIFQGLMLCAGSRMYHSKSMHDLLRLRIDGIGCVVIATFEAHLKFSILMIWYDLDKKHVAFKFVLQSMQNKIWQNFCVCILRVSSPHYPTCRYKTYIRLHVVWGGRGTHTVLHVGFCPTFNYFFLHVI